MSPKRLLSKKRSSSGLKPLLDFSSPIPNEDDGSRTRKSAGEGELEVELLSPVEPVFEKQLGQAQSRNEKGKGRAEGSGAPSPLNQSFVVGSPAPSPAKSEAVRIGKQRAADIMKSLIEQDIVKIDSSAGLEEDRSYVIFNPYDNGDRERIVSASSPVRSKIETPAKSAMKSGGTPLRGAAARLEQAKKNGGGRQMSTLEKLGVSSSVSHTFSVINQLI
jgi:hypothetical protein